MEAVAEFFRVHGWACASAGACASSFVLSSLPYLQWISLVVAIAAGIRALLKKR